MFYCDRLSHDDHTAIADVLDIPHLIRHRHSVDSFFDDYRQQAGIAYAQKLTGLREITPYLLGLISDEKTIYAAFKHMQAEGSHAPGPDGLRYEDIESFDVWKWCRNRRDTIRDGEYTLSTERVQKLSKGPGRGFRKLTIQSVEDRVVQRAIVEILQPLLDPLFDPRSFGYRPKKGPLRALAHAEYMHHKSDRGVWVSVDIQNAFPSVPVDRLLAVLRKYFDDDELITFLKTVIQPDKTPGLRQGSPLSPLLLNLYLHHTLDRPWRRLHPKTPLLRFADDILLLCRTRVKARSAYRALADLLQPAGFTLKENEPDAIYHLANGDRVQWMGYEIAAGDDGLVYSVTDRAWEKLAEALETAHGKPHAPIRAFQSLVAWVNHQAPCYPHIERPGLYERLKILAVAQGFDEIPTQTELFDIWKLAYAHWCRMRKIAA